MSKIIKICIVFLAFAVLANDSTYRPDIDHNITLSEAKALIQNHQKDADPDQPVGGFFGQATILEILSQENAVGMRYYYALNEEGKRCLVLVGVTKDGKDMVDGKIAERGGLCPPFCGTSELVNQ